MSVPPPPVIPSGLYKNKLRNRICPQFVREIGSNNVNSRGSSRNAFAECNLRIAAISAAFRELEKTGLQVWSGLWPVYS